MRTLAVNEFFVTLQGEASFAGTPAVFVRFQGCPVACPWCDTQYAARLDGATLDFAAVRAKQGPGAGYADVEPEALLAAIREAGPRHVAEGFRVQIETSGTMPIRCHADVWVTLSPKLDMPGGLAVRQDAWERAGEIKFPVDTAADLARFEQALAAARKAAARPLTELVWLQPVSQGKEATRLCVEAAFAHQWRVSVQVHKYLDLR